MPPLEPAAGFRVHRVVAIALPGLVAFDLSIAAQVFGHAEARDHYSFAVCAPRPGTIETSTGFSINVGADLEILETADTVVIPGFHSVGELNPELLQALRDAASRGTRLASVCLGAFALAAAGLLDGLSATTHWQEVERFRRLYPAVRLDPDVLYVDNGQILTSAGISAGIDLCIHLVRRDYGEQAASDVARRMVVAVHRAGGQLQFSQRPLPAKGGLGPIREWAISQMDQPLTVRHLASRAGIPERTFTRLFSQETGTSPMKWLTAQRVQEVQRLLEATNLTVEEISALSGLGSAATLRTHFDRALGTTPTAYRARHREGAVQTVG